MSFCHKAMRISHLTNPHSYDNFQYIVLRKIMKIPANIHYAIIIMIDIAMQGKGVTVSGNDIARRQNISFAFVSQLLNKLKHAELLESVRGGTSGGYILKYLPSEITIKKIIEAVKTPIDICPSASIKTNEAVDDIVRNFWENVTKEIEHKLEVTTIEDLAKGVKKL
jgi:Rrf2 family iron-sulfur cluster assembly transcriptional regulator